MLKKRIIPIQLLKNNRLVKGTNFNNYRDVGDPVASSAVYNSQLADELIFLNTNSDQGIEPLVNLIENISEVVFMPISFGGGIKRFEDAALLISKGADKVIINSQSYKTPQLIAQISEHYGNQAIIVCIDVKYENQQYSLYSNNGTLLEMISLEEHIKGCIELGAGEIMIQSIDNDGLMQGFELELAKIVCHLANIPIILAGGSGNYDHLKSALCETQVSAVGCGSLFNFSDSNPMRAKAFLKNYDIPLKKIK